jgi:hypothetical protein
VASAFAFYNSCGKVYELWGKNTKRLFIPNNPKLAEVHAIISVLKAMATWNGYKGV